MQHAVSLNVFAAGSFLFCFTGASELYEGETVTFCCNGRRERLTFDWQDDSLMSALDHVGAIHCAPYSAILPEIVPASQRSFAGAIMSWVGTIGAQISAALGMLVGQRVLSCAPSPPLLTYVCCQAKISSDRVIVCGWRR